MENVNHPEHYKGNGMEVIDVIEAFGLGFNLGNAVKYILRNGKKNPEKADEDLEKAMWYINRELASRKCAGGAQAVQDRIRDIDALVSKAVAGFSSGGSLRDVRESIRGRAEELNIQPETILSRAVSLIGNVNGN